MALQDNVIQSFKKMCEMSATKAVTASKEFARVGKGFDVIAGKVDALSNRVNLAEDKIYSILAELDHEDEEEEDGAETVPDHEAPPVFLAAVAKSMPRPAAAAATSAAEDALPADHSA